MQLGARQRNNIRDTGIWNDMEMKWDPQRKFWSLIQKWFWSYGRFLCVETIKFRDRPFQPLSNINSFLEGLSKPTCLHQQRLRLNHEVRENSVAHLGFIHCFRNRLMNHQIHTAASPCAGSKVKCDARSWRLPEDLLRGARENHPFMAAFSGNSP